ncbi:MAG: prepilin-type N-terminal cleavage/methylation domain-containing protein [Candidatus Microsaccharimonas sossegonensis]|uniref:Prepilin-type N-terminal cleavage/methylation domain-containing protein n=1 Tax=Candidatus Microsaccharimonas sossegonensis TaxID=2506948 RepID=A0A4Q0AHK9_9BACT|nr:MAG: prepilin-type N-terminal cleavage/methylation domain-containing protein [Candidatus Microsaccharimonas sossegonensis]
MNRVIGRSRGFTLIELIVVIAVIGILATITTIGFSRYQAQTRDTRRVSNVTVIAEALEKYYDANGEYPSCKALTQSPGGVSSSTLKGIDAGALRTPTASVGANSITCGAITTSSNDLFGYVGDGSSTCTDPSAGTSCISFELQYKDEESGTIQSIKGRRNTDINTSGKIALTGTSPTYTTVNLTWNAIPNAGSYLVTQSKDLGFTTNVQTYTTSTNSYIVTNLTPNTNYFYKVQAVAVAGQSDPSNTAAVTTLHLGKPVLTLTVNNTSTITASWTAASNADASTTYTLQRSTSSNFSSGTSTYANLTTTSYVSTGLSVGNTYYFRVQAVASTDTSDMSDIQSASTAPNQPTGVAATTYSSTQVSVSWNAMPGATSYNVEYSLDSSFSGSSTITGITATNSLVGGLSQGTTYYFRVYALAGTTPSSASASAAATTTIDNPAAYGVAGNNDGSAVYAASQAVCASGTMPYYYWYANGGGWVEGTQYQSVGYALSPGQGVTLSVNTRCIKGSVSSGYTGGSNSVSYTRPGMNPYMVADDDGCSGGFCGRRINAYWNNICGSGVTINASQLSYRTSFSTTGGTYSTRWKGGSGGGVYLQYDIYLSCASASAGINVISAYKCTGCS